MTVSVYCLTKSLRSCAKEDVIFHQRYIPGTESSSKWYLFKAMHWSTNSGKVKKANIEMPFSLLQVDETPILEALFLGWNKNCGQAGDIFGRALQAGFAVSVSMCSVLT